MNEKMDKLRQYIKDNGIPILIFLACLVYISHGLIELSESGKTLLEVFLDGALLYVFGLFINRLCELQGLLMGERDEKVISTNDLHAQTVEKINPYIDQLDPWCEIKNKDALKTARITILSKESLKYDNCFDEEGNAKDYKLDEEKLSSKVKEVRRQEKKKFACFKSACNVKLTKLASCTLTSNHGKPQDPYNFGRTKKQYMNKSTFSDAISKIGVAVIGGLYAVDLIQNFSWANLIWQTVQVFLVLLMGGIKLYQAYIFVKDEQRGGTVSKIDNLMKFYNYAQANETEKNNLKERTNVAEENI